ncbi:terminase large subunit, partial [Peribacillus sp. NPDC097675]|uniref:terminase large subunit n=1 Tax=Peribacillus sp. NPDC097675 TaxID=3390618 RepID=UPI003D07E6BE
MIVYVLRFPRKKKQTNWMHLEMNYAEYIESVKNDPLFCPVTLYSLKVIDLSIKAGKSVQQACMRHIEDLKKSFGNSEWEFSRKRANHIFSFYEVYAKHSKGEWAGQPVTLELWQKFIVGSLMGWVHKEKQTRRFTLSYTQIGRKNGKSLLSSGLSLYMFMIDNEAGAECYCASVKRDTAKIVWLDAMRMVKASPLLRKNVRVQESLSTMKNGNAVLKALSADSGQDGLNIHFFSLDEYHLARDNKMYDVLVSAMGSRRNPLGFIITTAGESKGGTSPCYMFYEYCKQVLSHTVENESLFIYIAEMDSEEEIHDSSNWIKSNPNLGVSVKLDSLEQAYLRAKDGGEMDNFLIKHMNRWIQRKDAFFPLDHWGDKPLPNLDGKECYIGIDLSSKIDLTSVTAVF